MTDDDRSLSDLEFWKTKPVQVVTRIFHDHLFRKFEKLTSIRPMVGRNKVEWYLRVNLALTSSARQKKKKINKMMVTALRNVILFPNLEDVQQCPSKATLKKKKIIFFLYDRHGTCVITLTPQVKIPRLAILEGKHEQFKHDYWSQWSFPLFNLDMSTIKLELSASPVAVQTL